MKKAITVDVNGGTYSRTIISQWFKYLLPAQILSSATASLSSIINGLIVGNCLPPEALVALGFVVPMTSMLGAIAAVISGGGRILCGQYMGRGDLKKLNDIFTDSIILAVVIGAAAMAAGLFLAVPLARLFGATGAATAATAEYIRGIALGMIPTLLVPGLVVFLQMANEIKYAFASSLVLAAVSLAGGLLNVKVWQGGVFGMGIASSAGQWITALFLLFRFVQKKDLMRFSLKNFEIKLSIKSLALGSPAALAMLLYAVRNVVLNSMALKEGGAQAVSALAILNSAMGPFDAVNIGTGATILILASVFTGEKDDQSMQMLMKTGFRFGILLGLAKIAVLVLGGKWLAILFGAEGMMIRDTYVLIVLYSLSMPLNMVMVTFMNPYQSLGRVSLSNIIYLFNALLFPLGWCALAGKLWGTIGMWLCYSVAEVLTLAVIMLVSWKKCGHFPRTLGDYLWIPESGNVEKCSLSLRTMDQVTNISQQLIDYCMSCGMDARRSKLCGLCMEEMAGNVILHGFAKGKPGRDYTVDLFVCCEEGEINMRLRDNAPAFDPRTKFGVLDPEDPCKNVGIRMVAALAKEINYQSCFGMNTVSIKL